MKRQLRDIQPGIAMLEEVLKTIENKRQAFMHINDVRFCLPDWLAACMCVWVLICMHPYYICMCVRATCVYAT